MKDAIVNSGAASEEEIGLDTLEQRLGDAFMSANAVFSLPTVVGGRGRRPEYLLVCRFRWPGIRPDRM
jgi:hypothetical protein